MSWERQSCPGVDFQAHVDCLLFFLDLLDAEDCPGVTSALTSEPFELLAFREVRRPFVVLPGRVLLLILCLDRLPPPPILLPEPSLPSFASTVRRVLIEMSLVLSVSGLRSVVCLVREDERSDVADPVLLFSLFLVPIRSRRLTSFPNLSSDPSLLSFVLSVDPDRADPPRMESSLFTSASRSEHIDFPSVERSGMAPPVLFVLLLVLLRVLRLPPLPELPTETSLLSIALSDELARVAVEGGFVCCRIVSVRLAVLADASASF